LFGKISLNGRFVSCKSKFAAVTRRRRSPAAAPVAPSADACPAGFRLHNWITLAGLAAAHSGRIDHNPCAAALKRMLKGRAMRTFVALIFVIAALLLTDAVALDGRYRVVLWEAAKYHGQSMRAQVNHQFRKFGL
jgi:hypothetical protein